MSASAEAIDTSDTQANEALMRESRRKYAIVGIVDGIIIYGCRDGSGHFMGRNTKTGEYSQAHRLIYENAHGPVPKGYSIHHIDGDHDNNDLSNLIAITHKEHKRIHMGFEVVGGEWCKRCPTCGILKKESEYYLFKGKDLSHKCKKCHVKYYSGKAKQARALKKELEATNGT